ncbi:hypothetical protein [Maribacter stanieri]|nr:hypothetical protein [Maribacter stanieri]
MRKILMITIILCSVTCIASCDYDDSNDIDILTPNDSTNTGISIKKLPQ